MTAEVAHSSMLLVHPAIAMKYIFYASTVLEIDLGIGIQIPQFRKLNSLRLITPTRRNRFKRSTDVDKNRSERLYRILVLRE
jgi:hypothetical protein